MKRKDMKYRPCNGRTISFSILTFMLFFITTMGIFPSAEGKEKNIVFFLIIILFLFHIIFVLYSLLKLNSPICLDENKIVQKQFGKIISIKYDNITDVKLSYFRSSAWASYAIKIYDNKKRIMFETSSKVFDVFMKYCANVEVKNKIEILFKEKGIYLN